MEQNTSLSQQRNGLLSGRDRVKVAAVFGSDLCFYVVRTPLLHAHLHHHCLLVAQATGLQVAPLLADRQEQILTAWTEVEGRVESSFPAQPHHIPAVLSVLEEHSLRVTFRSH